MKYIPLSALGGGNRLSLQRPAAGGRQIDQRPQQEQGHFLTAMSESLHLVAKASAGFPLHCTGTLPARRRNRRPKGRRS